MQINVCHEPVNYADYHTYANKALGHALRSADIADVIGVGIKGRVNGRVKVNLSLSDEIMNCWMYIISGPKEYGGAIKGYALLGFLEYHTYPILKKSITPSRAGRLDVNR